MSSCGYSSSGLRDGRIRSGSSSLAVVVFRKLRESRIFTLMDDRVEDHMEGDHGWKAVGSETMDRRGSWMGDHGWETADFANPIQLLTLKSGEAND